MSGTAAQPEEHGTLGAYQAHRKRDEEPCDSCRAAAAAYMQQWRKNHPELYSRELAAKSAKRRAWSRLASEYPERFAELLNEERLPAYRSGAA
jgi:hypothetical protein